MLPTIAGDTAIRSSEQPAAPPLLWNVDAEVTAAGEGVPELGRRLSGFDLAMHVRGTEAGADARDGLPEQQLLLGGHEVEAGAQLRGGHGRILCGARHAVRASGRLAD